MIKELISCLVSKLIANLNEPPECTICYEPFLQGKRKLLRKKKLKVKIGQVIARLECFCVLHNSCFDNWLKMKQFCPLHAPF